jgi:hypothetical protein
MNADVDAELKKALLPHQYDRLKQIDFQTKLQSRGEGGLSTNALSDALELTDEQREKLEKKAEEVREELRNKIRQAQSEAMDKLLDALTPEQKAKVKEMMGDQFSMRDDGNRFGGGFRGRGDRGDRGSREGRGDRNRGGDSPRERKGDESI